MIYQPCVMRKVAPVRNTPENDRSTANRRVTITVFYENYSNAMVFIFWVDFGRDHHP